MSSLQAAAVTSAHRFYCSCGQDGIGKTWLQACGSGQVVSMATRLRLWSGAWLIFAQFRQKHERERARIRVEVKGDWISGVLPVGHAPLRGLGHAPQEMFEI